MKSYYDYTEFISNSDIGSLDDTMRGKVEMVGLQKIFNFGNLVDASITEGYKINRFQNNMIDDGGRVLSFEAAEMKKAELMKQAFDLDPLVKAMFVNMKFQHAIFKKQFPIEYEGSKIFIPARCKFDGLDKKNQLAADIKTTSSESQAQFVDAFEFFNYDRQAAWYMDLARVDRMIYVGISKKKLVKGLPAVFRHAVNRDDKCYLSGKAKYQRLAFKYYFLIHQLYY